eukprot:364572-Chlamydomonas_euryale.AAC.3
MESHPYCSGHNLACSYGHIHTNSCGHSLTLIGLLEPAYAAKGWEGGAGARGEEGTRAAAARAEMVRVER